MLLCPPVPPRVSLKLDWRIACSTSCPSLRGFPQPLPLLYQYMYLAGIYEALELRDKDPAAYMGKGVSKVTRHSSQPRVCASLSCYFAVFLPILASASVFELCRPCPSACRLLAT